MSCTSAFVQKRELDLPWQRCSLRGRVSVAFVGELTLTSGRWSKSLWPGTDQATRQVYSNPTFSRRHVTYLERSVRGWWHCACWHMHAYALAVECTRGCRHLRESVASGKLECGQKGVVECHFLACGCSSSHATRVEWVWSSTSTRSQRSLAYVCWRVGSVRSPLIC